MGTKQLVYWFFYFMGDHFRFSKPWIDALKQDEEIRMYVVNELRQHIRRWEEQKKIVEKDILFLET